MKKIKTENPKEFISDNQFFNLLTNIEFGQNQSSSELIHSQQN
jgi:hypothetical protein